jgi:hypothetical protein
MWEWAWAYFRYQKGARLITGNSDRIASGEVHAEARPGPQLEIPPASASTPDRKVS